MTTPELWQEIESGFSLTAKYLTYLAYIWRELEARGEDMSRMRAGVPAYLPLIASGAVIPEVVVQLHGIAHMMELVSLLPSEKQIELLEAGTVSLAVFATSGYTHRMIPLCEVTLSQAKLIFHKRQRRMRSIEEQVRVLATPEPVLPLRKPKKSVSNRCVADAKTGTVRIGKATAPAIDMLTAMREAGMITR